MHLISSPHGKITRSCSACYKKSTHLSETNMSWLVPNHRSCVNATYGEKYALTSTHHCEWLDLQNKIFKNGDFECFANSRMVWSKELRKKLEFKKCHQLYKYNQINCVVFITAQEDAEAKKASCIIEALEVQTTHPMANYLRPVNIQVWVRPSEDWRIRARSQSSSAKIHAWSEEIDQIVISWIQTHTQVSSTCTTTPYKTASRCLTFKMKK